MADSLRDKLAKNTAAAPLARAAQTFTTAPAGESIDRSADRNNSRTTVVVGEHSALGPPQSFPNGAVATPVDPRHPATPDFKCKPV